MSCEHEKVRMTMKLNKKDRVRPKFVFHCDDCKKVLHFEIINLSSYLAKKYIKMLQGRD